VRAQPGHNRFYRTSSGSTHAAVFAMFYQF
jgi:hypothetical protein